jgi:hypothetical protein
MPTGNRMSYAEVEKDQERQGKIDIKYETFCENLKDETEAALEILNDSFNRVPRHTSYKERLEVFALRLTELSEIADRLAGEFDG